MRRIRSLCCARVASGQADCRAAEHGDELAAPYSITSSASATSLSGTLRPSVLAVLRLMTISNMAACVTGRSDGFSPLRMRPT